MAANPDYKDLFRIFLEEEVEYLVVGAHAVIFYAEPRYTKDIDVFIKTTADNAQRVWNALKKFGAPLGGMSYKDFTDPDMVYQIGVEPNRIDIMMGIEGVDFDSAWKNCQESTYDGVPIHIIGRNELIRAKEASNRPEDRLDLEKLRVDGKKKPEGTT